MKRKFASYLLMIVFIASGVVSAQPAQAKASEKGGGVDPQAFLNANGTLRVDADSQGALSLGGWNVRLDEKRGPVFSPQSAATNTWLPALYGTNGYVNAIVIDSGKVYVGGSFQTTCGNAACNSGNSKIYNFAVWDGATWSGLGGYGVNSGVYAIAVSGSAVYISGYFNTVCSNTLCNAGTAVKNIAKWNGTSWANVGYGLDSFVFALAVNGNTLYAGGSFSNACGNSACNSGNIPVNNLAKWDGASWSQIGFGVSTAVYALALNGADLYIGGYFTQLCGNAACNSGNLTANRILKRDLNTSTWDTLLYGVDAGVRAIAIDGANIYVGGFFTQTCGNISCNSGNVTVNHITKWNGSTWLALSNGFRDDIYALAVNNGKLFASGIFNALCPDALCIADGAAALKVASWDGSAWSGVGDGLSNQVLALAVSGTSVYAGGTFVNNCGDTTCSAIGSLVLNYFATLTLPTPVVPVSVIFTSIGAQDGWVLESSEKSAKGGTKNNTATTFNVGDNAAKKQYRGILSFDTSTLPDTATLTSLVLKVKKNGVVGGGNPVTKFKGFMADIKNGNFSTASLALGDFKTTASATLGPVVTALASGWYSINLTSAAAQVNLLGNTQIRLRFKVDDNNNLVANYLKLYSGNAGVATKPQLVIQYTP